MRSVSVGPLRFIDLGITIGGIQGALIGPTATITGTREVQEMLLNVSREYGNPGRFLRAASETCRKYMVENMLSGQRLKRRTGVLASAWRSERIDRYTYRLSPGAVPYSRVHEYGLDYPFQPVRGYTTRSGRKVPLYFRHMKIKETRYVRDTVIMAEPLITKRLQEIVISIQQERAMAWGRASSGE